MTEGMQTAVPNSIVLEDRKRLTVEGVKDIAGYDDETVTAKTDLGDLTVRGAGLKILKMSVDTGELMIEGSITELAYADLPEESGGFWSRMFR
ncbi:MAG: sporulation protein YabP [Clostridia bacterium]|nr:sporulation protein YabP [Clostridia bacterium]